MSDHPVNQSTNRDSVGQSAELRTRLAAAIMESCHGVYMDDAVNAADKVIRELGPLVRYWDDGFKELHYCRECGGWGPME